MNFQNDVLRMIDTLAKVKIGKAVVSINKDVASTSKEIAEISKNIPTTPKPSTGSDVIKAYDELSEQEKLAFNAIKNERSINKQKEIKQYLKKRTSINVDDIKGTAQSHAIESVDNDRFMRKFKGDENK